MLVFNLVDKEDKLFLESSQQLCTKLQIVLKSWLWKKKSYQYAVGDFIKWMNFTVY